MVGSTRSWGRTAPSANRRCDRSRDALEVSIDEITINTDNSSKSYKRLLSKRYAALDFRGCSLTNVWLLALRSLYVPLRVSGEGLESETNGECDHKRTKPLHDCYSERTAKSMNTGPALIECINRYDRIYLKGEPGSGKTTFLKHIVLQYAEGEVPEKSGVSRIFTPLFVPLAEYEKAFDSESIRNPLEFVAAQARQSQLRRRRHALGG